MVPNEELHILTIFIEPLKRGQPLYKGQDVNEVSPLSDLMVPNEELHILTIFIEPLKRGQPLYKRQDVNGVSSTILYYL